METSFILKGVIALIMKSFNITIHILGLYLLKCLTSVCGNNIQMMYIVNLSATELIINIFSFSRNFARLLPSYSSFHSSTTYKDVVMYSYVLDYHLKFCLYMWMLYITIDRVFSVLLSLKYSIFWSTRKAKFLVFVTWMLALTVFVYFIVMFALQKRNGNDFFQTANYTVMVLDFSFVVTAATSYIIIFGKYKKSLLNRFLQRSQRKSEEGSQSLWKIFRRSRFYVSVMLISAYIVFTILPDLLWTFGVVEKHNIQFLMTIMYATSHLADGVIYIFMHDRVKKMLHRKLRRISCFKGEWNLSVSSRTLTRQWSTDSLQMEQTEQVRIEQDDRISNENCNTKLSSTSSPSSTGVSSHSYSYCIYFPYTKVEQTSNSQYKRLSTNCSFVIPPMLETCF